MLQVPLFSRSTIKWSERAEFLLYGRAAMRRAASRKLETPLSMKADVIGPAAFSRMAGKASAVSNVIIRF